MKASKLPFLLPVLVVFLNAASCEEEIPPLPEIIPAIPVTAVTVKGLVSTDTRYYSKLKLEITLPGGVPAGEAAPPGEAAAAAVYPFAEGNGIGRYLKAAYGANGGELKSAYQFDYEGPFDYEGAPHEGPYTAPFKHVFSGETVAAYIAQTVEAANAGIATFGGGATEGGDSKAVFSVYLDTANQKHSLVAQRRLGYQDIQVKGASAVIDLGVVDLNAFYRTQGANIVFIGKGDTDSPQTTHDFSAEERERIGAFILGGLEEQVFGQTLEAHLYFAFFNEGKVSNVYYRYYLAKDMPSSLFLDGSLRDTVSFDTAFILCRGIVRP